MALALRPSTKHQCHLCPKSFSRAYHLRSHLDAHQGIQRYCCTECQTLFVRKNDLRTHLMEKHSASNEKPAFRCHKVGPNGAVRGCGKVFVRKSLLLRHLRGAKAVACRDEAALPASLPSQSFSENAAVAPGRGSDGIEAEAIEEVYHLPASHLPQVGAAMGILQKHREHQNVPDSSVHEHWSPLRRLEFSDLTNIQWFSQDSFVDWDFVSTQVAFDGLHLIRYLLRFPNYSFCFKRNFVQWRCIYGSALTLTRKRLTEDRGSASTLMRWLTFLVFVSRYIREDQDCRTHTSELRRRCELVGTSGRAMGFSYTSGWNNIVRVAQREDALDESLYLSLEALRSLHSPHNMWFMLYTSLSHTAHDIQS